jgi:hypothetical protein
MSRVVKEHHGSWNVFCMRLPSYSLLFEAVHYNCDLAVRISPSAVIVP